MEPSRSFVVPMVVPPALHLRKNHRGDFGIFAERAFEAGDVIYRGRVEVVPEERFTETRFVMRGAPAPGLQEIELPISMLVHTVVTTGGARHLYGFDSFMNHSCEPNSYSQALPDEDLEFLQIAGKRLAPGDEITADYDLFDYDCEGKAIDPCRCGAASCRRSVTGFKNLPRALQLALIRDGSPTGGRVDPTVVERFLADVPSSR